MSTVKDLGICEDYPRSATFRLTNGCGLLLDGRKNQTPKVNYQDLYFVGFCLKEQGELWYHLSAVLADGLDSLEKCVGYIRSDIRQKYRLQSRCPVVYVRNLHSYDPALEAAAFRQNITQEINDFQQGNEPARYLIFGLLGGKEIYLQSALADDALASILLSRQTAARISDKQVIPLKACVAQPISFAFDEVVYRNVVGLKRFLDAMADPAAVLH